MWRPWTDASEAEMETIDDQNEHNCGSTDTAVTILDVLCVDLCAHAILGRVPVAELVRSERVSRRWQQLLHHYLQCYRSLIFYDFCYITTHDIDKRYQNNHRKGYSLQSARTAVEKWGHSIKKLTTACSDEECLEIIAFNCPYLQHIEFCNMNGELFPKKESTSDDELGLSRAEDSEENNINSDFSCVIGRFLKEKANNLTSLTFTNCSSLDTTALRSAIYTLRNIITLELDDNDLTLLENAHLLLNVMPQLENVSLSKYKNAHNISNENLILSLCGLSSLKRLRLRNNNCVNDAFVEALAQDCKLEYLDISADNNRVYENRYIRWMRLTARGVAALCQCRSPPAVTTLCLGYVQRCTPEDLVAHLPRVVLKLDMMKCLELRTQWVDENSRASFIRIHPLELKVGSSWFKPNKELKEFHSDLIIVLSEQVHSTDYAN